MKDKGNTNRLIIKLKESKSSSIKKLKEELNNNITSSAELNSKVRAQNIYDTGDALFLKNLGLVIIEEEELEKVEKIAAKSNSVITHFEKAQKIYKPVTEIDLLNELKTTSLHLANQIDKLEDLLLAKENPPKNERLTWGLNALGVGDTKYDGTGVKVCILDTGFFVEHPDFANRHLEGRSFVPDEADWQSDKNGHGTHVTGIAVGHASSTNGIRYGIASASKIVIGKVMDDRGEGSTDIILDALDCSFQKKHKVVCMAFGARVGVGEKPSPLFEYIGSLALANNCLLIAAGGNHSKRPKLPRPVSSPANCESIMAVAALKRNLKIAQFSNAGINVSNGGKIDISAPGVEVYSSFSQNARGKKLYATLNGTSTATPHIAGLAALYCQAFPNLSASDIWRKIEKNAKQLNNQLIRDVGNGIAQSV